MRLLIALCAFIFLGQPAFAGAIDVQKVEKLLTTTGVPGFVHGAAHDLKQYVFTYREPNVMNHMEFSMLAKNPAIAKEFQKLTRNDEVTLFGKFAPNSSAQKHILVEKLVVTQKFVPKYQVPARTRSAQLPAELTGRTELTGVVHATAAGGEVLVIEYKDTIVPVLVSDKNLTKDLYRGDRIRLQYTLQSSPRAPTHVRLDTQAKTPVEVLSKVADTNGKTMTYVGSLVLFPKMRETRADMYGVQEQFPDGSTLNHIFAADEATRLKAEKLWNAEAKSIRDGRNCFINPAVQVRATGEAVVGDQNAAAVLVLNGPDDLVVVP
ncbi:hypothetical protein K2X33_06485 [bacterium]|nr:hypothetical protein [bacterium]